MRVRLSWLVWAVGVGLIVPSAIANGVLDYPAAVNVVGDAGFGLLGVGAASTGAIVATRVPGNAIALGAGLGLAVATGTYGCRGPRRTRRSCWGCSRWRPSRSLRASRSCATGSTTSTS